MSLRQLLVWFLVWSTTANYGITISAQLTDEFLQRKDRRTLRERADEAFYSGKNDSLATKLYEQWLHAVPNDTVALSRLLMVYNRNGKVAEVARVQNMDKKAKVGDPRIEGVYTLQVRMGHYKVLLPKVIKPGRRYPVVLVLHGNGQNEETLIDWVKSMSLDSVLFVFPQAPYVKLPEVLATHRIAYSASDNGISFPDSILPAVIDASAAWYHDVLTDAKSRYPVSAVKPIVLGFSQGGFYSYVVSTMYPQTFQGVVSICASMYAQGNIVPKLGELARYGVEVLLTHGAKDQVVPLQTAELMVSQLQRSGVKHTFVPFDGGHWPNAAVTSTIRDWLSFRLH